MRTGVKRLIGSDWSCSRAFQMSSWQKLHSKVENKELSGTGKQSPFKHHRTVTTDGQGVQEESSARAETYVLRAALLL